MIPTVSKELIEDKWSKGLENIKNNYQSFCDDSANLRKKLEEKQPYILEELETVVNKVDKVDISFPGIATCLMEAFVIEVLGWLYAQDEVNELENVYDDKERLYEE